MGKVLHRWDGWTDGDGWTVKNRPFVLPPPPDDVVLTGALVFVWLTRRCSGARSNPRCRMSPTLCFYNIKKKNRMYFFHMCCGHMVTIKAHSGHGEGKRCIR